MSIYTLSLVVNGSSTQRWAKTQFPSLFMPNFLFNVPLTGPRGP